MFAHILVPLDGSSLAEAALPPAAFLAAKAGARVTLLHFIEHDAPPTVHGARHLTTAAEAEQYLAEMARTQLPAGLTVAHHVHTEKSRDVADSLVEHAIELASDLVVMCSHGHGRLRDIVFGSIAQQFVARNTTPVLLLRQTEAGEAASLPYRRLLVPDDGTATHEPGVDVLADLATLCGAAVHFVHVVETLRTLSGTEAVTGAMLPGATRAMLDMAETAAQPHLSEHVRELQARGLAVSMEIRRGEPVAELLAALREKDADLLVLRTHGKAGSAAFWSKSLTPKLAARTMRPLLLVPIKAK
jgi:nucleotide-binding universal stress UspA family protein